MGEGSDTMSDTMRSRRVTSRRRRAGRPARGRRLSVERLDLRAVLSGSSLLAVGHPFDGPGTPHDSTARLVSTISPQHGTVAPLSARGAVFPVYGAAGHRPGHGHPRPMEPPFGHRTPSAPSTIFPTALVVTPLSAGGVLQGAWFISVTTWSIPVLRGPSLGGLGSVAPAAQPAESPASPVSALPDLNVVPAVATFSIPSSTSPKNVFETTVSAASAAAPRTTADVDRSAAVVPRLTSTGLAVATLAPTPLRAVEGIFALPRDVSPGEGFRAPNRATSPPAPEAHADTGPNLPIFENEGGLIEPDATHRSAMGDLPSLAPFNATAPPDAGRTEQRVDDTDAFQLPDSKADDPDEEPDTPVDDVGNIQGDGESREDEAGLVDATHSANDAVAQFDEGGMIELDVGTAPADGKQQATDKPLNDTVDVTVDAGVALFQAFELSTEAAVAGPTSPEPPRIGPPAEPVDAPREDEVRATDEEELTSPGQAVLGAGLGVAVSSPWLQRVGLRDKNAGRWPTIRRPRKSG